MIIKDKFKIPKKETNSIYIPKLEGLFEKTAVSCVVVKAVSGFGKTTVLAETAGKEKNSVYWYSLDITDNERDCFLEGMERIWDRVDGGNGITAFPAENSAGFRVQALIYRAQRWNTGRICIILDNMQAVFSEEVLQCLFLIQDYTKEKILFILLTNGNLPQEFLPLLLQGKGMLLTEDDLRFQTEEVLRYFGSVYEISKEVLWQITRDWNGWPLGIYKTVEYCHEYRLDTSSACCGIVDWTKILQESLLSQYLDGMIWERCSPEIKMFLKQTAVLGEFSWETCQTVLLGKMMRQTFEKVVSNRSFLWEIWEETGTYRYCEAFRTYLLRMISSEEKQEICRRKFERHQKREEEKNLSPVEGDGMQGSVLRVCMFGAFQVIMLKDGKELAWRTRKGRELFAYLLDIEGKAVGRRQLIEGLWQDEIPENAVAMLHNMIYNIRKELSAYCMETILVYENKRYRLDVRGVISDFDDIRRIAELVEAGDVACLCREYSAFLKYWGGYLENIDSPWAEEKRRYYDEVFKKGCFILAEQFVKEKNYETAITLYQNILELEPYSEKAVEQILFLYGEQKEWEKVKRCYREFREIMERDLGIPPGKEVLEAYRRYLCDADEENTKE